ncbi:MAG: hypothetical protein ACHP65_08065 [Legionellales bacterium]
MFQKMLEVIRKNDPSIIGVDLSGIRLEVDEWEWKHKNPGKEIPPSVFGEAVTALKTNPYIQILNLQHTNIENVGLIAELAQMPSLRTLNLNWDFCELKHNLDAGVLTAFSHCKTLHTLQLRSSLSFRTLEEQKTTMKALADLPLRELDISWNSLRDHDIQVFVENNRTVVKLNINTNYITDHSARILAKHPALQELDVYNNRGLRDAGACEFAKNDRLIKLDISDCAIYAPGAIALSKSSSLRVLDLSSNLLDNSVAGAFAQNKTLQSLNIMHTGITTAGAIRLACSLTLKELVMFWADAGVIGRSAIQLNPYLKRYDRSKYDLGTDIQSVHIGYNFDAGSLGRGNFLLDHHHHAATAQWLYQPIAAQAILTAEKEEQTVTEPVVPGEQRPTVVASAAASASQAVVPEIAPTPRELGAGRQTLLFFRLGPPGGAALPYDVDVDEDTTAKASVLFG